MITISGSSNCYARRVGVRCPRYFTVRYPPPVPLWAPCTALARLWIVFSSLSLEPPCISLSACVCSVLSLTQTHRHCNICGTKEHIACSKNDFWQIWSIFLTISYNEHRCASQVFFLHFAEISRNKSKRHFRLKKIRRLVWAALLRIRCVIFRSSYEQPTAVQPPQRIVRYSLQSNPSECLLS